MSIETAWMASLRQPHRPLRRGFDSPAYQSAQTFTGAAKRLKEGFLNAYNPLALTTANRTYRYRVSKTLIVGPDDVYVLDPTKDPTLTLVTCYPFDFIGHAPKRFIIQATLAQP